MPSRNEHNRMTKKLLGFNIPIVHTIIDESVKLEGYKHRYATHNIEFINNHIEALFGERGKSIAIAHILQDLKAITKQDFKKSKLSKEELREQWIEWIAKSEALFKIFSYHELQIKFKNDIQKKQITKM